MFIAVANGQHVPVAGRGTVRLLLGSKVVEERDWLHVPALPMRLKSVRLHRRMHPDNSFIATHDECTLAYPSFVIPIDDDEDCVLSCSSALDAIPDFVDSPLTTGLDPVSYGHAFQGKGRRKKASSRQFVPFPQSQAALNALSPEARSLHDRPSSRDVPSEYVPDSAAPAVVRYTNEELHKLFGNRRLDWDLLAKVNQGGTVTDFGETPLSIGNFVNIRKGKRGKKSKIPLPGDTICCDIGYGDGISPGGHRYCLVVVDSGSRNSWCYGLRDLTGHTLCIAFQQLFVDMGNPQHTRRLLCDFDTKLIKGQVKSLMLRRNIRVLSSAPYRQSQNGLVERYWATAVRMARSLLQEANLPKKFWFWAVRRSFELMNMVPMEVGTNPDGTKQHKSPFELYYGQKSDLRTLFPFGCVGYFRRETDSINGSPHHRTKFQAQTFPGIALGRSGESNGIMFYNPETCRFSVSADYKLDSDRQVRTLWPELLNDGGFTLRLVSPTASSGSMHIGDTVLAYLPGPVTQDGERPIRHGVIVATPIPDQSPAFRIEFPDGTFMNTPSDCVMDPSSCVTDDCEFGPDTLESLPEIDSHQEGDPIHPVRPPWLKTGQAVTYSRNGQKLLGLLDLTETHRWAFVQYDNLGVRVTEIPLPDLHFNGQQLVREGVLEIGHANSHPSSSSSNRITNLDNDDVTPEINNLNRGTNRSGLHFRGHANHVSAKNLQRGCPRFLFQALSDRHSPDYAIWLCSYKEEFDGIKSLDTYEVIDEAEYLRLVRLHGIKAIPTMCIHTVKPDDKGMPDRAKSRIVVLGNEEDRIWTKNDLFAPVIMKHSIRCAVSFATSKGRIAKQCDAKNAFCHPDLPEDEVCVVTPPRGCPYSKPGTYWRLRKTLYGLRRSPRHWYQTFKGVLGKLGLTPCAHDPCLFTGTAPDGGTIYFGAYVDDCLYFGTDDATEQWFEQALGAELNIEFMGPLSYYLGVHYEWSYTTDGRLTVHMSQEGYIHKLLEQLAMSGSDNHHPVDSPYRSGYPIDRVPHDGLPPESKPQLVQKYQSVVGGLLWLSLSTRLDITAAVSLLTGYSHNPSQGHLDSAHHVAKYLKGTPDWGIRYTQPLPPDSPNYVYDPSECVRGMVAWPTDGVPRVSSFDRLDVCTDSNWGPQDASHPKDGEMRQEGEVNSLLGSVVTYLGGPLDWSCTREKRCSRSVCESEVKGMDEGVKMVLALRHLFADLPGASHISEATPMLYSDNQGGIFWAQSEAITKKMRHINIREVAVRDAVKFKEITIGHIPGPLNPADAFTKEMRNDAHFRDLRACLMSQRQLSEV